MKNVSHMYYVIETTLGASKGAPGVRHWFMGVVSQDLTNKTTGQVTTMVSNKWTEDFSHLVPGVGVWTESVCERYLPVIALDGVVVRPYNEVLDELLKEQDDNDQFSQGGKS